MVVYKMQDDNTSHYPPYDFEYLNPISVNVISF
jgi:hypothetical protein